MNLTRRPYDTPSSPPPPLGAETNETAGNSRLTFVLAENNCTVINSVNGSLAADWENIPETILLNATIGFLLFCIFLWLTHIAWRRADSNDQLRTQNIITFLYGYRDPERWYVIPRLEFLRHEDRHHQHDMQYPYIYVPPKLPLANPLEMFAYGQDPQAAKSVDSSAQATPTKSLGGAMKTPSQSGGVPSEAKTTAQDVSPGGTGIRQLSIKSGSSTLSDGPLTSPRGLSIYTGRSGSSMDDGNDSSDITRRDTLQSAAPGNSFFFPSILTAEQMQASWLSKKLNRFFAVFFRVSDADMIYSRGIDAYEYLLFQRHLIFIMFITTLLCMGIILPIHWIAGSINLAPGIAVPTSFQRSTIKNIVANSHLHWAHIVCSGLIVVVTLKVMSSYIQSIMSQEEAQISRRTLLIGNIPSEQRNRVKLTQIFREYFPRDTIEAIQFVYDTGALVDFEMYLSATIKAKEYCQAHKRKRNGSEIYVHSQDVNTGRVCDGYCRCCSFLYICCCYWPCGAREPGTEYYAREEKLFRAKIAEACERLVREPTEYAFVTFKSHKHARRVMSHLASLKQDVLAGLAPISRSGFSDQLESLGALRSSDLPSVASASARAASLTDKANSQTGSQGGSDNDKQPARDPRAEAIKQACHKFIESANKVSNDPLDPENNPHVRSIRSPVKMLIDQGSGGNQNNNNNNNSNSNSNHTSRSKDESNSHRRARNREASKSLPSQVKRRTAARPPSKGRHSFFGPRAATAAAARKLEGPVMWSVRYAPHPDNVEFADLLNLARTSKYTIVLLHVLMIIIFIFVTTPNVILSMIERLAVLSPERAQKLTGFQGLMINYFSILLQIIATAILPALITIISKQIPYEDSSTKGHSVMWKVYSFLILMVIVMPSIGMSSAQALFETDIDPKCLFPTDNGAYYINYVISSLFLSTILELIKPGDIVCYYFILWTSRSTAEVEGGRQCLEREFSVNMQHTQVLLIFSVVMTYSISCPLIAPVGLLYMCVKHAVDHYNLYYTYFTKKVDKDLQSTIVIFVKVALLLMLFQTTVAIYINTGTSYFSLLTQMIFWITLAALVFNCFFDCTSRTLPSSTKRARWHNEFCACFYLPKVISNLLRSDAIPHECISRKV